MSKLLITQDIHLKGKNPINRVGNYYEDVLTKIDEILTIAKEEKVDSILDGGDLFNSPLVANTIVDDFLDRIEDTGIQWQVLYGNHCEIGNRLETSTASSMAHIIRRSKLVNHLTEIENKDIFIKGYDYYHGIEKDCKKLKHNKKDKFTIAIVHSLITKKPLPFSALHIPMDRIDTNYDLVIIAHNHHQFEKEIKGTKFIANGCIGRRKIAEIDIIPKVLLLDTKTKDIEKIKLKSAKEPEKAFNMEAVAESKEFDEDINKFVSTLTDAKTKNLNIRDMVERLAKESDVDTEVKDEIIERIGGIAK